jgi:hypothetical protein
MPPSPWPSPARGEGTHGSSAGANEPLDSEAGLQAVAALDKHIPAPLAGEGQGEGDIKPISDAKAYVLWTEFQSSDALRTAVASAGTTGASATLIRIVFP